MVEIIHDICPFVEKNRDSFVRFINDNHDFKVLTYQRMVSYWNEYYRHSQYKYLHDYPGKRVFNIVDIM